MKEESSIQQRTTKEEPPAYTSPVINNKAELPYDDTFCPIKKIIIRINAGFQEKGVKITSFENGRPVKRK